VHSTWAYSNHFPVHQRLDQLGRVAYCVYAIVICRGNGRGWHQGRNHLGILIFILELILLHYWVGLLSFIWPVAVVFCSARTSRRWILRLKITHHWLVHFVVVGYFWKTYFLETTSSLLVKLILELSKLTTAICTKTVKMSTISKGKCMSLSAGNSDYLLITESMHFGGRGLVRFVLCILWQVSYVIKSQLA
jgi:hypothetical protein